MSNIIEFGYDKSAGHARGLARTDWSMNALDCGALGWRMQDRMGHQWGCGNRRFITRNEAIEQLLDA